MIWPEHETLKSKRASDSKPYQSPKSPTAKVVDADDDFLVFDGHYFKPNEVPPPPTFMVPFSNWLGMPSPKQQGTRVGLRPIANVAERHPSPTSHPKDNETYKFSHKNETKDEVSSSDSRNIFVRPASVDDIHNEEVANLKEQQELFKDAPACFTSTDTPGKCIPFKKCFPVVYNIIDGDLRNPGLAKLLYQASGPCNATLELDFALRKVVDDKKYMDVKFYNQTICCPGFKHSPEFHLNAWANDIRETRLSPDTKQSSTNSIPKFSSSTSDTISSRTVPVISAKFPTVGIGSHESSVEIADNDDDNETDEDDSEEDDGIVITVEQDILKYNSTNQTTSERRGDRDKELETETPKPNVFHSIPAPNLSQPKCRNQQFEMPRGHWPWMASDIALIKLNTAIPFSKNIQPISLPDPVPLEHSRPTIGKAIVAGWSGADIGQVSYEARIEAETVVDILDKKECRELYRGFVLNGVALNTICTKPANNTCVADSGAPLVARMRNCWELHGIMSWGLGCSHFPEVYTDVTRYVSWIRKHIHNPSGCGYCMGLIVHNYVMYPNPCRQKSCPSSSNVRFCRGFVAISEKRSYDNDNGYMIKIQSEVWMWIGYP
ncbi:unnamed protein product [Orchesella dallaii]|uniref:Peptidase S1 domain-containing protein n=1 Tax=Orchesella dallaii TaxID=48710 RepID=A0ABP1QAI2_9HEXA